MVEAVRRGILNWPSYVRLDKKNRCLGVPPWGLFFGSKFPRFDIFHLAENRWPEAFGGFNGLDRS